MLTRLSENSEYFCREIRDVLAFKKNFKLEKDAGKSRGENFNFIENPQTCYEIKPKEVLRMGTIKQQEFKCKNGALVVLRNATLSDAVKLNDLASEVSKTSDFLITTPEEFSSFGEDQQKERIKKYEDDEGSILLVLEHKGELIGMIDFQNGKRKRIAHKGSFGMSVRSSWRNKGVGSILLSGLIEWVKNHPSIEVINLGVIEDNKSAVALYSKKGFEITGREPFGVKLPDGKFLTDLAMTLRVHK